MINKLTLNQQDVTFKLKLSSKGMGQCLLVVKKN
jgi:hypothetical protein